MACMELSDYLITRLQMLNRNFTPKQKQIEKGFLSKYAKTVSGANLGAVCE